MKEIMTARECEKCKYVTIVCNDNLKDKCCKHCGGLLRIIMREK